MKIIYILCLLLLMSCSHYRAPASVSENSMAHDSMALGNINASATKRSFKEEVCFDITLKMKNVTQNEAQASNWTVAWIDKSNNYHPIPLNLRGPASSPQGGDMIAPYGHYQEFLNSFTTCAPLANSHEVKGLILVPKELPYQKNNGLTFHWKE